VFGIALVYLHPSDFGKIFTLKSRSLVVITVLVVLVFDLLSSTI